MPDLLRDALTLGVALIEYNISLTVLAVAVALPLACLFAMGRLSRSSFLYYPVTVYVNLLRSSPLLTIMFWAYYTGPMLTGRSTSAYTAGVIALTAFEAAYFTELVRAGVQSVPRSQLRAALATGLSPAQVTRKILLPQALRWMLPSILTQTIIAFQDSTIASIIGVSDVFQMTNVISAREQRPIELYSLLALMFLIICFTLSRLVRSLDARISRRINGARLKDAGFSSLRGRLLGRFAFGLAR